MDPKGKVAMVTGGASGIGLALIKELLQNGAQVVMCDKNAELAKESMKEIAETFGKDRAIFVQTDVTSEADIDGALKTTKSHFKRLDIVVNNAGMLNEIEWEKTIEVNLISSLRGTMLALKHMGKDNGGDGGVIVNTASVAGLDYFAPLPAYVASKHAVIAMSKCYGMPFHFNRTGVRVLAICPGATETPLLRNMDKGFPSQAWADETGRVSKHYEVVKPDVVAKTFIKLIREAESSSMWVSEGQEAYPVEFQDYRTFRPQKSL